MYGDGKFASAFGQTVLLDLAKKFFVLFADEYRTSQTCFLCQANIVMVDKEVSGMRGFKHKQCVNSECKEAKEAVDMVRFLERPHLKKKSWKPGRAVLVQRDRGATWNFIRNTFETIVYGGPAPVFLHNRSGRRTIV